MWFGQNILAYLQPRIVVKHDNVTVWICEGQAKGYRLVFIQVDGKSTSIFRTTWIVVMRFTTTLCYRLIFLPDIQVTIHTRFNDVEQPAQDEGVDHVPMIQGYLPHVLWKQRRLIQLHDYGVVVRQKSKNSPNATLIYAKVHKTLLIWKGVLANDSFKAQDVNVMCMFVTTFVELGNKEFFSLVLEISWDLQAPRTSRCQMIGDNAL